MKSNFHLHQFTSKFHQGGIALIILCLLFGIWYSCRKDEKTVIHENPFLTISRAKQLLAQSGIEEISIDERDGESEQIGDGKIHLMLDWKNLLAYHDGRYNLDVIEVKILHSNLSTPIIESTTTFGSTALLNKSREIAKLLFTINSIGTINMTLLKISGTPAYLINNEIDSNSFKQPDSDFEGRVAYYDLKDSLLKSYLVHDGVVYESIKPSDTAHVNMASDRWQYCIDYCIEHRCTGGNHTYAQRAICECGKTVNCTPPSYECHYVECGGPMAQGGAGTPPAGARLSSLVPIIPSAVPTSPVEYGSHTSEGFFRCFLTILQKKQKRLVRGKSERAFSSYQSIVF